MAPPPDNLYTLVAPIEVIKPGAKTTEPEKQPNNVIVRHDVDGELFVMNNGILELLDQKELWWLR